MNVLSIDIGIINLGYVYSEYYPDFAYYYSDSENKTLQSNEVIKIIDCNKVDITIMKHNTTKFCDCKLHHDNCFPDYLEHFFQEYSEMFNNSQLILVERQPITGITNVQDLILNKYREKTILISPNSVHKHFCMSKNYTTRKKQSELIAMKYLYHFSNFINKLRKHDISDAMLLILYYYETVLKKKNSLKNNNIIINNPQNKHIDDLEQFRFIKN